MTSELMTKIGLGGLDIAYVLIVLLLLLIVCIVLLFLVYKKQKDLQARYDKFMQGEKPVSLEKQFQTMASDVSKLKATEKLQEKDIDTLFEKHESALQKFGLVKYDAFKEMGGNLSFCLAVLDENDNGFILNSVHSTTGCYSYIKRIRKGACDLELGNEERVALDKAMGENRTSK